MLLLAQESPGCDLDTLYLPNLIETVPIRWGSCSTENPALSFILGLCGKLKLSVF